MKYIILCILTLNGLFASDSSHDMQVVKEKVRYFYTYIEKSDTTYNGDEYSMLVEELGYPEVSIYLGGGEPLNSKKMTYFTKQLNTLIVKEMQQDVSSCLDYNFLTAGQDDWLTDFKVDYKQVSPTQINVTLTFKNFNEKIRDIFYFRKINNIWLIEDINNGSSLLKTLESCKRI